MTILYLDAIAGISGDMTVAALLDLGLPIDYLQQELEKLALPQDSFNLSTETVVRQGMHGRHFAVHLPHEHHHHGEHHSHHHHRNYSDIRRMISESSISERAKELSLLIFLKLAEAEAKAHQVPVDDVCFHEVGAVDSIVDIVGAAIGLDWLDVNQLYVSPLPLGGGFVETAHGRLPVPAPATAALLKGFVLHARCGDGERVTPTGAAILAALATPVSAMPDMAITKTGQGAGTKDFGDCPNILRAFIGEPLKSGDKLVEARCNLDDVTGEQLGYVMERLFESGALDVWHTSIQMKKQRPGVMLSFLCAEKEFDCLCKMVFAETGTLGLRYQQIERFELERTVEELPTCFGKVRFKLGEHGMKPEYDDCRRIAREQGQPLRTVQKRLMEAKV